VTGGALPTHYAGALADAVFKENSGISPEDALAQLRSVEEVVRESKQLQLALHSPAVTQAHKIGVVGKLADLLQLHRIIKNFMMVIVRHRRISELTPIRQSFEEIIDERLGWVRAEVASAQELGPEQRQEIERALGTKLGKFIRADYKVDPALLAGVRARVASQEYDASLKGRLETLRQRLQTGL
jgi:F-type H+-transporting ATPase subunit delta